MTSELAAAARVDAPFSGVCAVTELPEIEQGVGRYSGLIDRVWTIGKKVHGGTMVAASAAAATSWLRAVEPELGAGMAPISTDADFLGAPNPGEVEYRVRIKKTGRQICLVDTELVQDGRTMVRSAVTFGQLDDTEAAYTRSYDDMPLEPPADAAGYEPGSTMSHIVHVGEGAEIFLDREWAVFLDGKQGPPRMRLWIRPRAGDAADPEVAAYFAMMAADICPPVTANLGSTGWAPTVQMATYLRRTPAPGWLRVVATTHEIGSRMFDEDHVVLDSTGAVVAQSRQLALIPRR
ncbi:thioesterase family protein [Nocardia callitridis]|uniref:Thioesterase family protein n=1 Tax=Nocardia callitridis TaxID=648753 RepID=A0ABP9KTJ3_9NOCA